VIEIRGNLKGGNYDKGGDKETHNCLYEKYDHLIAMLITMATKPNQWKI